MRRLSLKSTDFGVDPIFLPFRAYIVKPKWQAIGKDFCQILGQLPGTYVIMLTKKSSERKNGNMLLNKNLPAPPRGIEPRFGV